MINMIPFHLFEKSISFISSTEVITKKFIEIQYTKGFLAPYAAQYSWEENRENIDIDDDSAVYEITELDDFKEWLEYELKCRFDDLKDLFKSFGSQVTLYREMTVKSDYLQRMMDGKIKRIGRYWAYDENSAESHWGYNKGFEASIVFESVIKEEHIDWIETFRLNLEHEYLNEEKEIRLFKNTKLTIKSINWNGKKITPAEMEAINKFEYLS